MFFHPHQNESDVIKRHTIIWAGVAAAAAVAAVVIAMNVDALSRAVLVWGLSS